MSARPRAIALALAFLACCGALTFIACSEPDDISTVNVTLREFTVSVDQRAVPDGQVTFHVTNAGTVPHEFLVIQTDLAADGLPKLSDGSFDEDGQGADLLDEIDEIEPGQSRDLTITLDKDAVGLSIKD